MKHKHSIRHSLAQALIVSALAAPLAAHAAKPAPLTPLQSADPMVGTDGHGHTYPGATVPFGMVQLSPDTRTESWDGCSGYHYSDSTIQGFSHTHLTGTGCGDLGDIMLMPTVGGVHFSIGEPGNGYISRFSHANEKATPGDYKVFLDDPKVAVELTATNRCGFHKYTFPQTDSAHIVLDVGHGIGNTPFDGVVTIENDHTISGYKKTNGWASNRSIYFVMEFSKPFASVAIAQNEDRFAAGTTTAKGSNLKAVVNYATKAGESVLVKVGISGTSIDGARRNLAAEIPGFDFAATRTAAQKMWSHSLGAVQIETPDPKVRRTFYSNMYLSHLAPILFNDVDGKYMGMDHKVHEGKGFQNYTEFSLWDTYRAENPLLTLVEPHRVSDLVSSLLAEYDENGLHSTPIWPLWGSETFCMIGYHSAPVIVDAYFKGFKGFDPEKAYQAIRDTAMQNRSGLDTYKTLGYAASQPGAQATSKTIEYSFDDWCIARMAKALGHDDDAEMFLNRSANYRNHFDSRIGFMRGRKADGSWRPYFVDNGLVGDEYTEADAWQYSFAVQHDLPGLIKLYGGDAGFIQRMDDMFNASSKINTGIPDITGRIGQFAHGDEQCHHVSYLYDYAGAPWKTQERVREVMNKFYDDTPAGQCGNDDCGQMSAWYVFSAMGFYPVNPASGVYMIGSPVVSKATLHLDPKLGGKVFTVIAANNSPKNIYIQSAALNGKPMARTWFTHKELLAGGTLKLTMGSKPNKTWGKPAAARPPMTMPSNFQYAALPAPSFPDKPVVFTLPIRVAAGSDENVGSFLADPGQTEGGMAANGNTIDTSSVSNAAPAGVYQSERYGDDVTYAYTVPTGKKYTVRLHFAEIVDGDPGMRVENIYVNGKPVLTDFDIFKVAGGMNKAIVKEFSGIAPGPDGKIKIRVAATPTSPDQNAKISGLEILEQ
ncbi:MAG: GH92 family glycosyl hydrolase [Capsulimonas sp.]|uniref:GH92 family glycosyl hydrolase n=1 Tax=Capsulimonas sp. TaxID=2494211 RepID=UPI003266AF42